MHNTNDYCSHVTNAAGKPPTPPIEPRRVRSDQLFDRAREVVIVHRGRDYRLRLTQNDKLILTA